MKKMDSGEKRYDELSQPIDIDVPDRYDGHSDTMVHVSGDHFRSVDVAQYYKESLEKKIETKYRRFSFKQSGLY